MKAIKKLIISVTAALLAAVNLGVAVYQPAYAADAKSSACQGVGLVTGSTTTGCGTPEDAANNVNDIIAKVVNILSFVVGIAAVVMIIVAGIRFVVSGGDAASISSARNTILYAIVGLIVVALAQVIVRFVINKI